MVKGELNGDAFDRHIRYVFIYGQQVWTEEGLMSLSVSVRKRLGSFMLDVEWEMGNELAVLFGPSGAGKTMTLQMIAGLMTPDAGCIKLGNSMLYDSSASISLSPQERGIGYVFQGLALFPHMTVRQNILYGGHDLPGRERETAAQDMMKEFRIYELRDRLPHQVSGGQKQRTAIARALMRRPEVLLLDEPFSALDMSIRREMRTILTMVQRSYDIPVVLITHDADDVRAIADRMIVYSSGRTIQSGPPEEVSLSPACPETGSSVCLNDLSTAAVPCCQGSYC
jgi:molybdate transport system ATP-binding protein